VWRNTRKSWAVLAFVPRIAVAVVVVVDMVVLWGFAALSVRTNADCTHFVRGTIIVLKS